MTGLMNSFRYDRIDQINKELKLPLSEKTKEMLTEEKKRLEELNRQSNRIALL